MSFLRPVLPLLALCALQVPAFARKTDVVTMDNGDVVTCDIKELSRGKLRVKTDRMDTVYIDWLHIGHVESDENFQLQLGNGEYRFGTLTRSDQPHVLRIVTAAGPVDIAMGKITVLAPIDSSFRDRINGSVSVGFNYTKASDVGQFNFFLGPTYRTQKYLFSLNVSAINTFDAASGTTRRQNLTGGYQFFLKDRWFVDLAGGFENNDELGLDLRTSLGTGVGRHLYQTQRSTVATMIGLSVNHEDYADGSGQDNLEALFTAKFSVFDYDTPIKDITIDGGLFPNLTDSGRLRATTNARVRWELVKDLTFDLTFYADYDSGSDQAGASTGDYGIVTSLGYSL